MSSGNILFQTSPLGSVHTVFFKRYVQPSFYKTIVIITLVARKSLCNFTNNGETLFGSEVEIRFPVAQLIISPVVDAYDKKTPQTPIHPVELSGKKNIWVDKDGGEAGSFTLSSAERETLEGEITDARANTLHTCR